MSKRLRSLPALSMVLGKSGAVVVCFLFLLVGCASTAAPSPVATSPSVAPSATRVAAVVTHTPQPPAAVPAITATLATPPTATVNPVTVAKPSTKGSMLAPARAALGDTWARPADGMSMVYVPGGEFQMGSGDDPDTVSDELPPHRVTLDGFWIDQMEVTNAQFVRFLNEHGNGGGRGSEMIKLDEGYTQISLVDDQFVTKEVALDRPVVMVTWYGAAAYCEWAGGRLPTEAEWEYAARGPEGNLYPWGKSLPTCDLANHGTCVGVPVRVGSRPDGASWCGALDLAGNVWEWVSDWFGPYSGKPQENPTGPTSGDVPVLRGGGWHSPGWQLRAVYREHELPANGFNG